MPRIYVCLPTLYHNCLHVYMYMCPTTPNIPYFQLGHSVSCGQVAM